MKKSIALPEPVLWLFQRLEQAGYQVYAVGGCVGLGLVHRCTSGGNAASFLRLPDD